MSRTWGIAVGLVIAATAPIAAAPDLVRAAHDPGRFGVMTDLGVPDGATASVVYRPGTHLRINAGAGYNAISPGVRAGVTWIPISWWLSPVASVDVGHFFERDANKLARAVSGDPTFGSPILDRVGYDFADAHVGLEFGQRWCTFYLHAGVSGVETHVHNLSNSMVTFTTDPTIRLWAVSARLGFVFYVMK